MSSGLLPLSRSGELEVNGAAHCLGYAGGMTDLDLIAELNASALSGAWGGQPYWMALDLPAQPAPAKALAGLSRRNQFDRNSAARSLGHAGGMGMADPALAASRSEGYRD